RVSSEDVGVGEAGGVVDANVDELPADRPATASLAVGARVGVVLAGGHPVTGALGVDPAELLDVDVDELTGTGSLISDCRLQAQAHEPTQPAAGEDPRNGGLGHPEDLGQLGTGEAQAPQGADRLEPVLGGAV